MKKNVLIICLIVGIAFLVAGGAFVYTKSQTPDAITVKTTPLSKETLHNTISATGVVESYTKVKVSNASGDTIEKFYVAVGDWVEKGDWLCQLYNKETDTYTDVKSDTSGTITAINATKGAMANGELFTIEDTNDLRVIGKVKEADINQLHENMTVAVKSDATGTQILQGNLIKIAPTAIKTDASADTTKKAEFEIEVDLPADSPGLKIGMTTRLSIISEEKTDVFNVPLDSLITNEAGQTCIYVAKENPDGKGTWMVESIPVNLGMETDLLVEISSDQLTPGMAVIVQPQTIQPGATVALEEKTGA